MPLADFSSLVGSGLRNNVLEALVSLWVVLGPQQSHKRQLLLQHMPEC